MPKASPLSLPIHGRPASVLLVLSLIFLSLVARAAPDEALVGVYLSRTAERLPPRVRETLQQIDGRERKLLAARAYLRAGDALERRWSWSDAEIAAFERSPERRILLEEIARVRARFEEQNPGYTLYANTEVRSLDVQLRRWNSNEGALRTALDLYRDAAAELASGRYPAQPGASDVQRFGAFLRGWRPRVAAPLAAPGLSLHGQLRAIDFQIVRGGEIVAPTQIALVRSVWERGGWARRLEAAALDSPFVGPLRSPNEPWHYEYAPAVRRAAARGGGVHASAGL